MVDFGMSVLSGVVANVIYKGLDKGVALTKGYLVDELSKHIIEDKEKLKLLAEKILELNEKEKLERLSEKYIKQEVESSKEIVEVMESIDANKTDQRIIQTHNGIGDNVVGIKNG